MRLRMKRMLLAVLAAAMSLVLSGCFVKTVDELYTLPKHSDEYNRLEQAIDQVMSSQNASYAAPVSGMNQQSVQLAAATHNRLMTLNRENEQLHRKLDEIRLVDRAKCLLIEHERLTEAEAHRTIEKQAMDQRLPRARVAQLILDRYEL